MGHHRRPSLGPERRIRSDTYGGSRVRIGINLLLWTTEVGAAHEPVLRRLKASGYDGVEVPLDCDDLGRCRAVRRILDDCGLAATAITSMTADANPISTEASVRRRASEIALIALYTVYAGPVSRPGCWPVTTARAFGWRSASTAL